MKDFLFDVGVKVYFGKDQLKFLPDEIKNYSDKILLTYGHNSIKKIGLYDNLLKMLKDNDIEVFELSGIDPNPRIESVRKGIELTKENNIGLILAVGGGSTIDCSKFIAAGHYIEDDPWKLVTGQLKANKALPLISILTLSATGSEMNSGGVISNPDTKEKLGNGYPCMLPKVSFLNPEYTFSVNEYQTACGSCDILVHTIENYFTNNETLDIVDQMAYGIMKTVIKNAPICLKEPDNYLARANLMYASSWAINGFLHNSNRWSIHPIEHELSAYYDITHGLGLAIITPKYLRYVLDETNVKRYADFAVNVFNIPKENKTDIKLANEAIEKLEEFLYDELKLDSNLKDIGIDDEYFDEMVKSIMRRGPIKGFKTLKEEDIKNILKMCM